MKTFISNVFRNPILFGCISGTALAAFLAWAGRYEMNQDGMSYADMAVGALREGPIWLVNPLWSAGYPAFLALTLGLLRPNTFHEFPAIHFANFLIFLFSMSGFVFFIRKWAPAGPSSHAFQAFGFSLFLWYALKRIGLDLVTPDLMVLGIVFFTAGFAVELWNYTKGRWTYVFFGFLLGLGYYVKAPLFLFNAFLLLLFLAFPSPRTNRIKLLLTLSVFLFTALPFVTVLSRQAGHWTLGESGSYNYLWHVDNVEFTDLVQPGYLPFGTPSHPPRVLVQDPISLEFAEPIGGTYPLHYDPSYWYAGLKPQVGLRRQWLALKSNSKPYIVFFLESLLCLAGAVLLFLARSKTENPGSNKKWVGLATWALAAMAVYAPIHTESRYLAPFCALLWLALYRPLAERARDAVRMAVLWGIAALYLAGLAVGARTYLREAREVSRPGYQPDYIMELEAARSAGLKPGDLLAVVGKAGNCYFAHLGGFKIVVETFDVETFQKLSRKELSAYRGRLKVLGVKAIFLEGTPPKAGEDGWKRITASMSLFPL